LRAFFSVKEGDLVFISVAMTGPSVVIAAIMVAAAPAMVVAIPVAEEQSPTPVASAIPARTMAVPERAKVYALHSILPCRRPKRSRITQRDSIGRARKAQKASRNNSGSAKQLFHRYLTLFFNASAGVMLFCN
jgi:hypothetical protein